MKLKPSIITVVLIVLGNLKIKVEVMTDANVDGLTDIVNGQMDKQTKE